MILALSRKLGHVAQACEDAGIARSTHLHWLRTDVRYAEAVDEVVDKITDGLETMLIRWTFEDRNHQSARWLLEKRRPSVYGGGRGGGHYEEEGAAVAASSSDVEGMKNLLPESGLVSALKDLLENDQELREQLVVEAEIVDG